VDLENQATCCPQSISTSMVARKSITLMAAPTIWRSYSSIHRRRSGECRRRGGETRDSNREPC